MKKRLLSLVLFLLSAAVTGHADVGDYDIYLRVTGASGESVDSRHRGWSEALGFTHHIGEGVSSSFGYQLENTSHLRSNSFEIIKRIDSITPFLSEATARDKVLPDMEIEVCPKGKSHLVVMRYQLQGVRITRSRVTADAKGQDSAPLDIFELTYDKLDVTDNRPSPEGGSSPIEGPQSEPTPEPPPEEELPDPQEHDTGPGPQEPAPMQEPEECPEGSFWNGEFCEPHPEQAPCPPGQHQEGERCVCPRGSFWNGEFCEPRPEQAPCPPGQQREGERCVCPHESIWNGRECVPREGVSDRMKHLLE
jgi:type VI secretion system secreted protein Hcp